MFSSVCDMTDRASFASVKTAKVLQGLPYADGAIWGSASHGCREGCGTPGRGYLLQRNCTVICLCAQGPERFHPQLPQEQTRARAACVLASCAYTI